MEPTENVDYGLIANPALNAVRFSRLSQHVAKLGPGAVHHLLHLIAMDPAARPVVWRMLEAFQAVDEGLWRSLGVPDDVHAPPLQVFDRDTDDVRIVWRR